MFKTKLEVDKHVDNCLKKVNGETERNLRSFSFAKLYYNVGDCEHAIRYILSYLSVKPKSAEAYQLLGKCYEKQGKNYEALEAYKNSVQIDSKNKSLILKVCELLASADEEMNQQSAKCYLSLAQTIDPYNPVVYQLKEKLITTESKDPEQETQLLMKELENRPLDVNLRCKILKLFILHNKIKEAYKHITDIEQKNLDIFNNITWYETVAEVLLKYQRSVTQLNWEYWFLSVSVLDRLAALSLDDHNDTSKNTIECITAVFNFDQMLSKASQNLKDCPDQHLVSEFLNHYRAQLYFHVATSIFKLAKIDVIPFKQASNITLPVLFAAYHSYPIDLQSMWFLHLPENSRQLVLKWHKDSSFRCSQTGHVLLEAFKDRKSAVLEKASQYSMGSWREQVFKRVFIQRDQQMKMSTSCFVSSDQPLEPVIRLPNNEDILRYDETAQLVYPDSLHHYIWIALNTKLSDFHVKGFDGLQYTVKNLVNCAAETLNILDIQAFIYCATLCTKLGIDNNIMHFNKNKPRVLPAAITDTLGSVNQSKFIKAAYKMHKNEQGSDASEVRLALINGIEVVRCVGHHGLDVKVLVNLGTLFEERSKNLTKQSEIEANSARADLYWRTALPLLEKIKNSQIIVYPNNRLFEYKNKEMSVPEAVSYIEQGKLFTGAQLMKKKEYDRALEVFAHLKDPYASFYQAQIYKHMADEKTNQSKENVTSEMRSQHIILLSKARDCLYLTLDRLRDPSVDRSHPLNAQLGTEIEKIERLLSRIDPDNSHDYDGTSDDNDSDNSVGEHYLSAAGYTNQPSFQNSTQYSSKHDQMNITSTPMKLHIPRQEARPSPERLDAQIRQLMSSSILEQNKILTSSHRNLLEELRSFKGAVNNLTAMVEDLKHMKRGFEEIKKSVDELKHSVDHLQNVDDMVQEIKKEINELKKDHPKPSQLSEEDLYVLDSDYGLDYNINSNLNSGYTAPTLPNVYPNYPAARLPNPGNLAAGYGAPGFYPGLYPGLPYGYGGLGLPQMPQLPQPGTLPGTLPFGSESQVPGIPGAPAVPAVPVSYAQAMMAQSALSQQSLPSTSLGVGLLTGQSLTQQAPSTPMPAKTTPQATSKEYPVNVVITTSDPLPSSKTLTTSQPVLSVTIPPHHIKGSVVASQSMSQPHSYQIPMPITGITSMAPSILSKPPPVVTTQSLLFNVAPPIFSAVSPNKTPSKDVSLGLRIEKSLNESFNKEKSNTSLKSNTSATSDEEHDPCPDFKPIVPLPDEVPVNTGEENETEMFCERAKLLRHVVVNDNAEWKERGVGLLKILRNDATGKIRILMRREQVHKICANHFITKDMQLQPMPNNDRVYIWAAHDYADETMVLEKFCVRFKLPEEAKKFYNAFEAAKKLLDKPSVSIISKTAEQVKESAKGPTTSTPETKRAIETTPVQKPAVQKSAETAAQKPAVSAPASTLGGFVFSSTPTFKPKVTETVTPVQTQETTPNKATPFTSFTFGKIAGTPVASTFTTLATEAQTFSPLIISQEKGKDKQENDDDSHAEEFVPTAEFKPVVALPELVEVVTGEENCQVLFEARAKLFRYDTSGEQHEWKERGIGTIKVLKDDTSIRLLMRRDQVHKVCCNHTVLKNMLFKMNSTIPKAVVWSAQDFSEGVLAPETFTVRFKTEEQASNFLQTLQTAQTSLNEDNKISGKHHKAEARTRTTSWGDKFKPVKGSWECKNCYVVNEGSSNTCMACETSKSGSSVKKSEESGPVFSFGVTPTTKSKPLFGVETTDAMKEETKGLDLSTSGQKYAFGTPAAKTEESKTASSGTGGFGEAFKPKPGSWECKMCLVRNNADVLYCASCEAPKDDTVPKKSDATSSSMKGVNLDTPGLKFTFGIPPGTGASAPTTPQSPQVTFSLHGKTETTQTPPVAKPASIFKASGGTISFKTPQPEAGQEAADGKFIYGSPRQHAFEFKPRSPRRASAGQGDEESDGGSGLEEEEDNIYFKPVIPLPDKVEVKTGEEDEEVLFSQRAKLFRFVGDEWKERGLGDIKILRNKASGKLRVVMRRDQVLKICLNHMLTKDVEYLPKDEKTWLFHAADFSEGELACEQFCVRFKTPEVAEEFKKAVADALDGCDLGKTPVVVSSQDDSDEVKIVSETKVTPEEEKEAIRLGLPPKFFSYKQLPDCTCEQCKKDDEYMKSATNASLVMTPKTTKTVYFSASSTPSLASSEAGSVFATPELASVAKSPQPGGDSLKNLLLKPPIFGTPKEAGDGATPKTGSNSAKSTFSFARATAPATSASLFSPAATTAAITSSGDTSYGAKTTTGGLFGISTNIFGTPTSNTEPTIKSATAITTGLFSSIGISASDPSTPKSPATTGSLFSSSGSIFGSSAPGANTNTPKSTGTTGSLFSSSGSIFGATRSTESGTPKSATTTGSLFGSPASIFNNAAAKTTTTAGSLFGSPASIFSNTQSATTTNTTSTTAASIFSSNTSIFGGNTTSTPSVFGGSSNTTPVFGGAAPVFGSSGSTALFGSGKSNIFGGSTPASTASATPVFGGASTTTVFGSSSLSAAATTTSTTPSNTSIFGSNTITTSANLSFDSLVPKEGQTTHLKEDDEVVLKCDSSISFASLAANTSSDAQPAFSAKTESSGKNAFAFLGAGAPVFGAKTPARKEEADKSKNGSGGDSGDEAAGGNAEDANEENYDPHYEPIVPLPDQIVVSTGEEEEIPVFNEKAKLYRFDAKTDEWKERGVGHFKVLHHPINGTYRLLLRRDVVHKIVLNQRITPSLEFMPMTASDRAWMWAGYNYVENESNFEELAVKFKNVELAKQFYDVIQDVISKCNKSSAECSVEEVIGEDPLESRDNTEYEEEDYDEDDRSVMFTKQCTLSEQLSNNTWQKVCTGELQVYYDPELYAAKISVGDENGEVASNTLIAVNTLMIINKNECTWRAVEWAGDMTWRTLKATFENEDAAQEFHSNYLEGLNYARQVGIIDGVPHEQDPDTETED
ncbi:unnamed protein product [Acanthoscelides obtectus]|uniref:E3 SUMO-protein ligase RanBP2 n=1 Tax=Acanthoscelides obtectus TaxID=200917 RepID=A0A9P0JWT7_ACAOB|nr:unnamed protein product [Acanthoscelides obtectus]CAK1647060.1 E3 SUMO-protein ligase RanBP2 [Acanthoscelides obtectus]